MKSYYDMLDVHPAASADEIKRAFRREIAKYHPDKVQHLGQEFQEIAAIKAAELTQAYKTLSDEALRADYDAELGAGARAHERRPAPRSQTEPSAARPAATRPAEPRAPDEEPPPPPGRSSVPSQDRMGATDLVRKATVIRFRQALEAEVGRYEEPLVQGFDVVCLPKPGFLSRKAPPCVLGRFVPQVDAASVAETWAMASRMRKDGQRDVCVFVMGPAIAPARELATAIAEQRRKPMPGAGQLIMVPVHTRSWVAHVPNDAPPVVKSLLTRLRSA